MSWTCRERERGPKGTQTKHRRWDVMQQPGRVQRRSRKDDDCRWTRIRNALTLHELSSENADNVSLLTDPGSPSRLYLILPQHAFLVWDDKTPKHIDHQWLKRRQNDPKSSLRCSHPPQVYSQPSGAVKWLCPSIYASLFWLINWHYLEPTF